MGRPAQGPLLRRVPPEPEERGEARLSAARSAGPAPGAGARRFLAAAVLAAGLPACAAPPPSEGPVLAAHAGVFNAFGADEAGRYGLELRSAPLGEWRIAPSVGFSVIDLEAAYVYADLQRAFWLDERWAIVPRWGAGWFEESDDHDLGYELEFRSGIELEHRFANGHRVSLGWFHLSNAGIADSNPGTEELVLSYGAPLQLGARAADGGL